MSTYREVPCKYYISFGSCEKGREAEHNRYCQHCAKYRPRAHVHTVNRKKQYNDKQRSRMYDY